MLGIFAGFVFNGVMAFVKSKVYRAARALYQRLNHGYSYTSEDVEKAESNVFAMGMVSAYAKAAVAAAKLICSMVF